MTPPKHSVLRRCLYCDKEFYAKVYAVRIGTGKFCSRSCNAKFNRPTHRMTKSRTYRSWAMMIQRCTNPNYTRFPDWGGVGITVAKEWLGSFEAFFADMGERPIGKNLDRIKGKLGYFKGNCRWATPEEQNQNLKSNRLLTFRGETKCMKAWSRVLSLPYHLVRGRLSRGWTVEETFTIPHRGRKQSHIKTIRKERLYAAPMETPS
jgi:hypothetical protein